MRRNYHLADRLAGEDASFYNSLLHSHDQTYLVSEFVVLLAAVGLQVAGFLPGGAYDPRIPLDDPKLKARSAGLCQAVRWALVEDLSRTMMTHVFYDVRIEKIKEKIGVSKIVVRCVATLPKWRLSCWIWRRTAWRQAYPNRPG